MRIERAVATLAASVLAAAITFVASCRGAGTAPDEPAAPAAASWKDMDHDQRAAYMKGTVLPAMKPAFVAWEAEEFSGMNCATCHGQGATDRTFKMPNPGLPKLPADAEGFRKLAEEEPEAFKFMTTTVVPAMAKLLGEPAYDHATGQGFGCFRCHTAEK